jgi:hypothetical protein
MKRHRQAAREKPAACMQGAGGRFFFWRGARRAARLLAVGLLAVAALPGCGEADRRDFVARIQARCCKSESRLCPQVFLRSELERICGQPNAIESSGDSSRIWRYEFPDGEVRLRVLLDVAQSWDDPDPAVFIDLPHIEVR